MIIFRAEISHCRALVRWNGHAQAEAGVPASSPGACCSWRRPERRRVQGPWEQISGRECDHFRSKIRFHGPCAVAPRAVQVARAGAAVGSGTGRAGGRARPGGRGGTVKIENRPQQKICFGYTLYFSKTQIRIAIPFFSCTMCTGSIFGPLKHRESGGGGGGRAQRQRHNSRNTIEWPSWWPKQHRRGIWLCYK